MAVEVLSVAHVNANCSGLERSLPFYRAIGLAPLVRTRPERAQSGAAFGLSGDVRWDAWMMCDDRGMAGPAVDLLEWKEPRPVGPPPETPVRVGLAAVGLAVPDLPAATSAATAAGGTALGPHAPFDLGDGEARPLGCLRDPDGTPFELVERAGVPRLERVRIGCADAGRTAAWYRRVLSLEAAATLRAGPATGAVLGIDGDVAFEGERLVVRAAPDAFALDLVQWRAPPPRGRPLSEVNHVGLFRLAFLVEDVHASCRELARLGVSFPPPAFLDMGPEVPVDGVWAAFFRDPDGTCLELIGVPEIVGAGS